MTFDAGFNKNRSNCTSARMMSLKTEDQTEEATCGDLVCTPAREYLHGSDLFDGLLFSFLKN